MQPEVQAQLITNSQKTETVVPVVKTHDQMPSALAFAITFRLVGDVTTHILTKYTIFYPLLHDTRTEMAEINNVPFQC
jgi:hypothetical protein